MPDLCFQSSALSALESQAGIWGLASLARCKNLLNSTSPNDSCRLNADSYRLRKLPLLLPLRLACLSHLSAPRASPIASGVLESVLSTAPCGKGQERNQFAGAFSLSASEQPQSSFEVFFSVH